MFALQKYIFASNTFLHQIHFCIKYIFASNTFLHQIHFCTVFVFCCAKNTVASNIFLHQIHFCTAFVFCCAKNTAAFCFLQSKKHSIFPLLTFCLLNIFLWKMWCWTFSFGKCSAPTKCDAKIHFCKAYIFKGKCKQKYIWCIAKIIWCVEKCIWCVAKMHFCIKCIFATHQMHLCVAFKNAFLHRNAQLNILQSDKCTHKCICNILLVQKCCVFCFAKNKACCPYILLVLNIFLWKMWCRTFYFVKCSRCKNAFDALQKCIFATHQMLSANQNVTKRQNAFWLCKNAFDAKMHFCNAQLKFILTSNAFLHSWTFSFHQKRFCKNVRKHALSILHAKMHFCIKCIFATHPK